LALLRNPGLTAFSYAVRAAEGRLLQAGLWSNPELDVEVGEYDRGGQGFDSTETSVVLGQVFELGAKRRWRTGMARAEGALAGWDYERKRLDVLTTTAQRFVEVIAAQGRLELAASTVDMAEQTSRAVGERVKAGKEPPLQASKAEAEVEMARLDALEAQSSLTLANSALAAMWGASEPHFQAVEGDMDRILESIPSLEVLRAHLSANPDLARWDTELQLRKMTLAAEKAARTPDLTAAVGWQEFKEDGTDALTFGVGLPLPLFDRNQGHIAAAPQDLAQAGFERQAAELALATELAQAHAHLTTAHQRVRTLRAKVVPAMQAAFDAARTGYQQGKFGFLDMLDAQRGLFTAQGALLDALSDYHTAVTDLQRITGTRLEPLSN